MKQRELMESAMASHIPKLQSIQTFRSSSKINTPRKVQSRAFRSESPQIRIISSPKVWPIITLNMIIYTMLAKDRQRSEMNKKSELAGVVVEALLKYSHTELISC